MTVFQRPRYVDNFVQPAFDAPGGFEGQTLVVGGDVATDLAVPRSAT